MPTNLPPEAAELEERYRTATTVDEKITALEAYIAVIPKHKGTDHLRADLRKRLSKLKSAAQTRKGVARQTSPYQIDREGAGQVVVVGCANVGKSALVDALTNATPEVAPFPFTTWTPTPGMLLVEDVQIQLIDTPPLNRDYIEPELLNLMRRADLLLVMLDLQAYPLQQLEDTLAVLEENRILPEHHRDAHPEPRRLTFKQMLTAVNKADDEQWDEDFEVLCELLESPCPLIPISVTTGRYLDEFKRAIFDALDLIRVYSKPPGKPPDFSAPFVMKRGGTVADFAAKVHREILENLKTARVWGEGVYDGQAVPQDHVLHDRDVVELRA